MKRRGVDDQHQKLSVEEARVESKSEIVGDWKSSAAEHLVPESNHHGGAKGGDKHRSQWN